MRQRHREEASLDLPFIKGNLGVVLKESNQHAVIGAALAFQMVFLDFRSFYLEAGIRDSLVLVSALLIYEVFVGREANFLLS